MQKDPPGLEMKSQIELVGLTRWLVVFRFSARVLLFSCLGRGGALSDHTKNGATIRGLATFRLLWVPVPKHDDQ
jgi:hypothetical protein